MAYVIGISSGIFGAASPEERMQYLGISRKVGYCITQGVNFTQIDVETMSEFRDPQIDIEDEERREAWKRKVKSMEISLGFHGESQAMGGRETPIKLDSAIKDDYIRSHDRLMEVLDKAGKIGGKYYLLHSSESTPFILLGSKEFQPANLVDIWGRNFREFIENEKWIEDWIFKKGAFIWVTLIDRPLDEYITRQKEVYADTQEYEQRIAKGKTHDELMKDLEDKITNDLKRYFKGHIESSSLTYGAERYAYWIIAKWMERNNDKLWTDIAAKELKRQQDANNIDKNVQPTLEDPVFRESEKGISCWVPAVAAKYLWGHFNQEKCPTNTPVKAKDPKKLLSKYDMYFVIETPMAQAGMENLMRLSDPVHMCVLVEQMNFKYFRIALDFEHILSNYIDPKEMISKFGENHGNLVKVVHLGWPTPIIPAHMPIYVGSEQHVWIYNRLWELKQKGFSEEEDRYLIYERGSEFIHQSILAMRLIVEFLIKNTKPDELPDKFFGVKTGELASLERQRVAISRNTEAPLEGLLTIPEEDYTMLGRIATSKPGSSPEKWKKRELR